MGGFTESESQFGEWPHMCAVLHAKPVEQEPGYSGEPETVNLYQCGGSLIAPGVILTAAHCVDKFRQNPTELKIRCGEWDTQHQSEPYPHQDRDVQNLAIHPEFDGRNLQNDFVVLFVTEDFVLDQHLDTACLPAADEVFDGTTCFATGWGKDQFGAAGQYQVVLKEIDLPVVGHDQCQDSLRTTRLGQKFKLHDSFLCAGGVAGKDTCKGDGGSPLVCPSKYDPYTYVQAGIVAWGIGCGEQGTPGVYADVSKATCWIDQAITCHYGASTGNYNSFMGYTSNVCQTWTRTRSRHSSRRPTLLASSARSSITSSTSTVNAVFNGNRVLLLLQIFLILREPMKEDMLMRKRSKLLLRSKRISLIKLIIISNIILII